MSEYERRVQDEVVTIPSDHAGERVRIKSNHGMLIDYATVEDDGTVVVGPKWDRQDVRIEADDSE